MTVITEAARLAELVAFDVLDTAPEAGFDALVEAAALLTGCAISRVSLLDEQRQWFKARHGSPKQETPRDVAFCEHVLRADDALVVPDTRLDARFAHFASVTAEPGVRFYAGFPLRTSSGAVLGTLCVLDHAPRTEGLDAVQHAVLGVLADQVVALLELRRALAQREAMLQEAAASSRRYRALADNASDIVSHHLPDGTTLYVSPSIETVLGYDPLAEVGRSAPDRVHPEDAAHMGDALRATLAGGPTSVTVRSRHLDGSWRRLEVRLSPVRDDAGTVVEVHSVARDTSERAEAELRLRLSEDRFRILFDANPVGQVELSLEGVVTRVNTAFAALVGVADPGQLVGRTASWATLERQQPAQQQTLLQAVAEPGRVLHTERTIERVDGAPVEIAGTLVGVPGPDGRAVVLIGSAVDVTERNRSARRLSELAEELAAARDQAVRRSALTDTVLDTVGVGIVACDAERRLTLFNRTAREFHDMPPDPGIDPADWADHYALFAADGTTTLTFEQVPLVRALVEGVVDDVEMIIAPAGRPARLVRCDGRALQDTDGRTLGAVVVMADITQSRAVARDLAAQAAFTAALLETAHTAIWSCDATGGATYVNHTARRFLGWPQDESLRHLLDSGEADARRLAVRLLRPDGTELSPAQTPLHRSLLEGDLTDVEVVLAAPGQRNRTLLVNASRLRDANGVVTGAISTGHDVTDLRASEARFRAAFHDGPTPVARLDRDGVVTEVNPALRRLSGRRTGDLVGASLGSLVHADDRRRLARVLCGPGTGAEPVEVRLVRVDGSTIWCELATTVSAEVDGGPSILVQLLDVDGRKAQEHVLELAAQHDPLTGLANRSSLLPRIEALLDPRTSSTAGLLFLDLDGFKAVNDQHGHDAGDAVLVEVAARLLQGVRPDDVVIRLGGDEFVVVCPLPAGAPDDLLRTLASRVERLVSEPVAFGGRALRIGGSVGAAVGAPGQSPRALLEAADRAMYERKQARSVV